VGKHEDKIILGVKMAITIEATKSAKLQAELFGKPVLVVEFNSSMIACHYTWILASDCDSNW
jgi:hypothetical protein